jgi:hypothetical protein
VRNSPLVLCYKEACTATRAGVFTRARGIRAACDKPNWSRSGINHNRDEMTDTTL